MHVLQNIYLKCQHDQACFVLTQWDKKFTLYYIYMLQKQIAVSLIEVLVLPCDSVNKK